MQPLEYSRASESWAGSIFNIVDQSGQELVSIPIEFATQARCNTIGFALSLVAFCFREDGFLRDESGQQLPVKDPMPQGTAIFVRQDGTTQPCTPAKGPRFKYKHRPPEENSESGTMSNSSRSSGLQNDFRVSLIARDFCCLLSGLHYSNCTASHILPLSRPEYYSEVLGGNVRYLFKPEHGLLLRSDLHHSFDRGEWAFHPDGENLVVHVFKNETAAREHHGLILTPDRFRGEARTHPHRDLLKFHYQQCAIQRFRGYSSGFD
ncbi:hypothetical protein K437DRAFT_272187 [Tilletiaria anomala UBC 951]|uniref:HNH nuclease domain-containing protein n=1 Tax=Tilletiaria anomala (strain ATCC 24038 / CBS 436.72 / UBC 951) TaxID=1037660 RepID=A0A066WPJ0_TILAU|nr:uncharacterized protein K437DRAFT_272187 [Tilletiaria anomala UBC 951]KDN52899.1 hypothetical protein K437DRAFT_272187 [Tilletiaria anomala UBC 951]